MKEIDYLIVGAGLYGSVLAERLAQQGQSVCIIDRREHIGGNCYSKSDPETNVEYHVYGTHIFHTNSQMVWDYINQFTSFNSYHHQVLTTHKNKVYQMPINLETINSFYNTNLRPFEVEQFLDKVRSKENYPNPKNLEQKAINLVGRDLYEAFIKGYTKKQWKKDPQELPASIISRLPIRHNYEESYFKNSLYQGIPKGGYTKIFEKLLASNKIELILNCDYFENKNQYNVAKKVIYTGPIDRYFNYKLGRLEWRSVRFENEVKNYNDFQGTSVMNYADDDVSYTRIHEPKHLHPERDYQKDKTLVIKEYSCENKDEPYYPINNEQNQNLYKRYRDLANKEETVIFGGRLGTYSYYDMDQVIAAALTQFEKIKTHS